MYSRIYKRFSSNCIFQSTFPTKEVLQMEKFFHRPGKDILRDILWELAVTLFFYIYWVFLFMLVSLFLTNIWMITIKPLLILCAALTIICSVLHIRKTLQQM